MSFRADTLELGAELDRLAEEYDDAKAALEDIEAGTQEAKRQQSRARDADQAGRALAWLIEGDGDADASAHPDGFGGYGPDATVTVRGLDAGEYAKVENRTADANAEASGSGGVPGTGKLVFAAAGLVDAPFLGAGHPFIERALDADSLDDRLAAFAGTGQGDGLPIGVRKWIEGLVSDRTTVGSGNWRDTAGSHSATPTPAPPED